MHQNRLRLGLRQSPPRELSALPQTLTWIKGLLLRDGRRRGRQGEREDKSREGTPFTVPTLTAWSLLCFSVKSSNRVKVTITTECGASRGLPQLQSVSRTRLNSIVKLTRPNCAAWAQLVS